MVAANGWLGTDTGPHGRSPAARGVRTMSRAPIWFAVPLLALTLIGPLPSRADEEVVAPKILKRPFPSGTFCALPISITFTAPATPIRITFTAVEWLANPNNGNATTWTEQSIDNV